MAVTPFMTCAAAAFGKPCSRLGLASHGRTSITADDVLFAVERGVSFITWVGFAESMGANDAFATAIAALGARRSSVVVSALFGSRSAKDARRELDDLLAALHTDHLDVVNLYYVESREEWDALRAKGGALEVMKKAKADGVVRRVGVTSHQRTLAADMARSGELDVLMVRYNAAHRGAERDVFPVTVPLKMPVIAFTALRWGALLEGTPDDPAGFSLPDASSWYRFVLQNPAASVVLSAPHSRSELEHDLSVLEAQGPLADSEFARLAEHGLRVRAHAGNFA